MGGIPVNDVFNTPTKLVSEQAQMARTHGLMRLYSPAELLPADPLPKGACVPQGAQRRKMVLSRTVSCPQTASRRTWTR